MPRYTAGMMNPSSGRDDAKYYAVAFVMASQLPPGEERERYEAIAIEKLTAAVVAETRLRARCRDRELAAALRVRVW